ncbi:MAG: LysM peptidoglycan-binding domain-containing protein [Lachnospiraceae bacterium]|nr:LysM peptidoglycan-binding domain-containing protein [Lachnospiraceae bacterium]
MESGSAVVGRDERKKKYQIYVEEYVLSYLRRESDSLELSEIYFYGSRQDGGRKLYVYGAGRDKGIAAFMAYEPLSELVCRLTQAGPVFLVREPDGECRATGFQVFYDNNEAMQNYLLEWTGSAFRKRIGEKSDGQEMLPAPASLPKEEKKRTTHGIMSVQLCLILVVLVAIVITSTDSYDKMEELNRSAKEVFFAIENQEADTDEAEERAQDSAGDREVVVERLAETFEDVAVGDKTVENEDSDEKTDGQGQDADSDMAADNQSQDGDTDGINDSDGDSVTEEPAEKEEDILKSTQETSDQPDEKNPAQENEEENEEALSRSITRYYEVEQGDTLYTISQKIYGDISRVEKICEVNQISDPDKIHSGQRIILP